MTSKSNLIEAINLRHTVRRYKPTEIDFDNRKFILERVNKLNSSYNLMMRAVFDDDSALSLLGKFVLSKNARNFIVLAGKDNQQEQLGYCAADLMLYIQTLGLNSWFVGGTYNRQKLENKYHEPVWGIVVLGYGLDSGKKHTCKSLNQVSVSDNDVEWYKKGVVAALKAPTALNKQNFKFILANGVVELEVKESSYAKLELGILRYFFELASGKKIEKKIIV